MSNLPPGYNWPKESNYVDCTYCSTSVHMDEAISGENDETFCSTDCQSEWERDRAADRAEARNDLD